MKNIPNTEQISKNKYGFDVYTSSTRDKKYYGFSKTLIGALMIRDYGFANNWKPYPKICNSKTGERYISKSHRGYSISKQVNGNLEYFGVYDKLEDAVNERDLLIDNNWDYDILCECVDERINNKTICNGKEIYEKR